MFVIEVDHPDPRNGREYVRKDEGAQTYTTEVEKAYVFVERSDTNIVPWPTNVGEAEELEREFCEASQRPKRVAVFLCSVCANTSLTQPCYRHRHREG